MELEQAAGRTAGVGGTDRSRQQRTRSAPGRLGGGAASLAASPHPAPGTAPRALEQSCRGRSPPRTRPAPALACSVQNSGAHSPQRALTVAASPRMAGSGLDLWLIGWTLGLVLGGPRRRRCSPHGRPMCAFPFAERPKLQTPTVPFCFFGSSLTPVLLGVYD